jgi:hypothetical protein
MGAKLGLLTVGEKHRFRLSESRVLRRIFRSKRGEVEGGWKGLRSEELRDLYGAPNVIRVINSRRV